jgi:hypothetical protein
MMVETFPLPGSSFKILRLILIGYLHQGGPERKAAGPTEIGSATGMDATIVSRNNAFLAAIGLIESDGRKWRLTESGVAVSRALEYDAEDDVQASLGQLLRENSFVTRVTTFVRGRGAVEAAQLAEHIARTAGAAKKAASLTGARTIMEMLLKAGVLKDDGGVIGLARPRQNRDDRAPTSEGAIEALGTPRNGPARDLRGASLAITVNLSADDLNSDETVEELAGRIQKLLNLLTA